MNEEYLREVAKNYANYRSVSAQIYRTSSLRRTLPLADCFLVALVSLELSRVTVNLLLLGWRAVIVLFQPA